MPPCIPDVLPIEAKIPKLLHPLEPLRPEEIEHAVSLVKRDHDVGSSYRFHCVTLQEPPKAKVLAFEAGQDDDLLDREAFIILLDNATRTTYEAICNLTQDKVRSWKAIPNVQPCVLSEEMEECEKIIKAHPDFVSAIEKRGLDMSLVVVDCWAIGSFGFKEEEGVRLLRGICYHRSTPNSNFYSRPIDGLIPIVDVNIMKVVRIEDVGVVPVPPEAGNYAKEFQKTFRQDLKPLHITQPEGPSFQIDGHLIRWQKWQIRIGFTPREGLVLHTVGYEDQGRLRPILYRASMAEMVVPYGDPRVQHYRKNAFDLGEYGVGILANSLTNGCDCLGEIRYFDAYMTDSRGNVTVTKNAVCLREYRNPPEVSMPDRKTFD